MIRQSYHIFSKIFFHWYLLLIYICFIFSVLLALRFLLHQARIHLNNIKTSKALFTLDMYAPFKVPNVLNTTLSIVRLLSVLFFINLSNTNDRQEILFTLIKPIKLYLNSGFCSSLIYIYFPNLPPLLTTYSFCYHVTILNNVILIFPSNYRSGLMLNSNGFDKPQFVWNSSSVKKHLLFSFLTPQLWTCHLLMSLFLLMF